MSVQSNSTDVIPFKSFFHGNSAIGVDFFAALLYSCHSFTGWVLLYFRLLKRRTDDEFELEIPDSGRGFS